MLYEANESECLGIAPPKLLESWKNSGIKGSDFLWSILARKKMLEKAVKVTVKENEQEIKSND